jgi:hypothetical protein
MNTQKTVTLVTVAMGMFGCLIAAPASASCGVPEMDFSNGSALAVVSSKASGMADVAAALQLTDRLQSLAQPSQLSVLPGQAVVGLWKFTFLSLGNSAYKIPDGAQLDAGFQSWHSDGTEIMNSGKPPITSSFCMGVWNYNYKTGYKLNHYALSWDPTGQTFEGPANIREQVQVDRTGNNLSGTVTIDQYDATGTTIQMHLGGTVSATRINPN